ncbi:PTPA-CTERM sorting domain-containing protein [[Leptolyngbya] sp. PCC 7376]|uniref:PTPA-CTERM sorting domain-containing protein n=1 Tax=[Leptolyngbya] sp. PCC 7376 TaxID=111781 RepID=UPI001C1E7AF8|nr:PTPA-CTERM sorting domain-containing protein [[Leptolyngbya] sp. PCC 7376]
MVVTGFVATSMLSADPVDALTFDFSYRFESGDVLSGVLEGNILTDEEDVVIVSEITSSFFNSTNLGGKEVVNFFPETDLGLGNIFLGLEPLTPIVTFSGFGMDLFACDSFSFDGPGFPNIDDSECDTGFFTFAFGEGFIGNAAFGEAFNAERWSLTPVPTPATVLPILTGLFGAASKRRQENA